MIRTGIDVTRFGRAATGVGGAAPTGVPECAGPGRTVGMSNEKRRVGRPWGRAENNCRTDGDAGTGRTRTRAARTESEGVGGGPSRGGVGRTGVRMDGVGGGRGEGRTRGRWAGKGARKGARWARRGLQVGETGGFRGRRVRAGLSGSRLVERAPVSPGRSSGPGRVSAGLGGSRPAWVGRAGAGGGCVSERRLARDGRAFALVGEPSPWSAGRCGGAGTGHRRLRGGCRRGRGRRRRFRWLPRSGLRLGFRRPRGYRNSVRVPTPGSGAWGLAPSYPNPGSGNQVPVTGFQ
jgi:hypothetical protein